MYDDDRTTRLRPRLPAHIARMLLGDEIEPELRGVLAASFASTMFFGSFWTFFGIWAVKDLGASSAQLGVTFLLDAVAGALAAYAGGHLSDLVGRRPVLIASWAAQVPVVLLCIAARDHVYLGLALGVCMGGVAGPGLAANQALIPDIVAPARQEAAYAALRVAFNLGIVCGPPAAGLLLLRNDWTVFFSGIAAGGLVAVALAFRFVPARGRYSPEAPPERGSLGVLRRDHLFLLFLGSNVLAYIVYFAFETVLPISVVQTHGVSPTVWGALLVINPALVTLFQVRLTRVVEPVSRAVKLLVALPLMGFPFLLLSVDASVGVIVVILVVFVVGEMLWVPTSAAIAARMAPADLRGAYMGAYGSTSPVAFALGPLAGLQIRGAAGETAAWTFFALVSVVAAMTGAVACRLTADRTAEAVPDAA